MQEQVTYFIDDITGKKGEDVVTRLFGLDGVNYEIDLSDAYYKKLTTALALFVGHARKVSKAKKAGGRKQTDATAIREWARKSNKKVSDRGRIPEELATEYYNSVGK